MIGKVCRRGTNIGRLLGYLFTEGLDGKLGLDSEHRDARVIAGYQAPSGLEPDRRADGRVDVSRLAALLDAPVRAGGVGKDAKPTYHLAISAAPTDRLRSGTPTTTSTSSRRWCVRTDAGSSRTTTPTGPGKPASRSSGRTG